MFGFQLVVLISLLEKYIQAITTEFYEFKILCSYLNVYDPYYLDYNLLTHTQINLVEASDYPFSQLASLLIK
jgi:hypothetical protein